MLKLAVIGKDVSKSDSPKMHSFIAENMGNQISYEAVSIPEEQFEEKIDGILSGFDGFNVTIPYKLSVMPHLKNIKGDATTFGAVNTVVTKSSSGYNTDGLGFMLMLKTNGVEPEGKKVLLLGAGGAGRSVAKKLTARMCLYTTNFRRT
jgi:shikimate dehydrogenase